MRMFLPFGNGSARPEAAAPSRPAPAQPKAEGGADIDALRRQLDEMQNRLDRLSDKK
jgi:hypothetical protein